MWSPYLKFQYSTILSILVVRFKKKKNFWTDMCVEHGMTFIPFYLMWSLQNWMHTWVFITISLLSLHYARGVSLVEVLQGKPPRLHRIHCKGNYNKLVQRRDMFANLPNLSKGNISLNLGVSKYKLYVLVLQGILYII